MVYAWTVMLKILLFNGQLCEITRYTGAPALYSTVPGRYWKKTRELTLRFSLSGAFYITVLLLNLKNAQSGRCGRKLDDFLFCLGVFFLSMLFLKYCGWLKGCCLTSCMSGSTVQVCKRAKGSETLGHHCGVTVPVGLFTCDEARQSKWC